MKAHRVAAARLTAALVLAALAEGCGPGAVPDGGRVLARFSGGEITLDEFDASIAGPAAAGGRPTRREGDWRVERLEELALREIAAARAAHTASPELAERIAARTESLYEAAMRRRLGWDRIQISNEQVRRYYDEHPEIFVDPERLRLQHIFVRSERSSTSPEERAAARATLEQIRRQVLQGADFAAMAQQHSDSADGPAGGWMILRKDANAVRSFTEAAWALRPDEVSEVIDTPAGFHIARLAARIPAVEKSFEEVRDVTAKEVLKRTRRKLEADYLAQKGPLYGYLRHDAALRAGAFEDETVVLTVAGEDLTFGGLLEIMPSDYLPHLFAGYLEHVPRVLDQYALSRILVREAVAAGVPDEPQVRQAVESAAASLRAEDEIERRLEERVSTLSEAALREYYEQNKSRFETVRQRSVSVIRLPPSRSESLWQTLERGEALVAEIRAGADFGELARRVSAHVSAADGGRLVRQTDDELQLRLQGRARGRQVVDDLEPGETSSAFIGEVYDPVKMQFVPSGVYIVRLDEEFPPRQAPFEEVVDQVRRDYLRRYRARLRAELRAEVLSEAGFRVVADALPDRDA